MGKTKPDAQFRCNFIAFQKIVSIIKPHLIIEHFALIEQTPFASIFWAFFDNDITKIEYRKSDEDIKKLIRCYNKTAKAFEFSGKQLIITIEDISGIFDVQQIREIFEEPNVEIGIIDSVEEKFFNKYFKHLARVNKSDIDHALIKIAKKTDYDSIEDTVRLLIIQLLATLFFCNSGYSISKKLIYKCVDIEKMDRYDWCAHIHAFFSDQLDAKSGKHTCPYGCVIAILYWFCEVSNIIPPTKRNLATCTRENKAGFMKWNLSELHLKLQNLSSDEIEISTEDTINILDENEHVTLGDNIIQDLHSNKLPESTQMEDNLTNTVNIGIDVHKEVEARQYPVDDVADDNSEASLKVKLIQTRDRLRGLMIHYEKSGYSSCGTYTSSEEALKILDNIECLKFVKVEMENYQERLKVNDNELINARCEIDKLHKRMKYEEKKFENQSVSLKESGERIKSLEKQIAVLDHEINEVKEEKNKKEMENLGLIDVLDVKATTICELQEEIKKLKRENEEFKKAANDPPSRIVRIKTRTDRVKKDLDKMEGTSTDLVPVEDDVICPMPLRCLDPKKITEDKGIVGRKRKSKIIDSDVVPKAKNKAKYNFAEISKRAFWRNELQISDRTKLSNFWRCIKDDEEYMWTNEYDSIGKLELK